MKIKKNGEVVGFIVTPGEIENRVKAIDASIQALVRDVAKRAINLAPGVAWRAEFNAFARRWALERDSYATWDSRLFATRVMPRLDAFVDSYKFWARDFETKSASKVSVPLARESEGLADSLVPTQMWWIVAGCAVVYVALSAPKRW
jgi:hypothetical protein